MRQINDTIEKVETHESDQQSVDTVYNDFCETLKSEMNRLLNPEKVLLSSATQTKKKRLKKKHGGMRSCQIYGMTCVQST